VKHLLLALTLALIAAPLAAAGQSSTSASAQLFADPAADGGGQVLSPAQASGTSIAPFHQFAVGGGVSPLGVGLQVATNINQHLNLRGTGNFFGYTTTFATNGFSANAKLNLASAGAALDYYPFHLGFRLSPGLLFYNGNQLTATDTVAGGTSFTVNGDTFYSANANSVTGATPANGSATLNLATTKPAFTMTTGWGNMIPRKGWRVSFPFEIGVALIGAPSLKATLGGWACTDQAQTMCTDLSSNNAIATEVQADLQAQVAKWNSDLNPLKTYPIVSIGVAYSFGPR